MLDNQNSRRKRVILWTHLLDKDFLKYLKDENIEVIAVIQAAPIEGIPSISPFDLFYRTNRIPFVEKDGRYIHLDNEVMRLYLDCISRVSFIPLTEAFTYVEMGIIGPDNVTDWAQFHAQTALQMLLHFKPDEVWISHEPHLGIDNVFSEVARQLGLIVLTFRQSLLPGKFFYNIVGHAKPELEFSTSKYGMVTKDQFYMKLEDSLSARQRFLERVLYYLAAPFSANKLQVFRRMYLAAQKRDWALSLLLMDLLCIRTREIAFTRFVRRLRYRRYSKTRVFCDQSELKMPFIYFALHRQPEQSTSVLGGYYANQINAIEALREILPDNWWICVKENPKQQYTYRTEPFYRRLQQWSNVKFIGDSYNTYDLIQQSKITASITGTVGYEALSVGKPCIYFGDALYAGYPNAYKFDESLNLEVIASRSIDSDQWDVAVTATMKEAADGVIMPFFRGHLPKDVDWPAMMRATAKSVARISNAAHAQRETTI